MAQIAVIGSGVAGIVAAHLLQQQHTVTVFEKADRLGGHTNTVEITEGPDRGVAVDTGFIVCNDRTYPTFHRFLADLNVSWRYANMSFSVSDEGTGLEYGSLDLNMIFAQRKNLVSPRFLSFLLGIKKFWSCAAADVANPEVQMLPLREYLKVRGIADRVVNDFVVPISAAIWSTPDKLMLNFPTGLFLKFYANHGLLSYTNQPRWQTIVGGSKRYLEAFERKFSGKILLGVGAHGVVRDDAGVTVIDTTGTRHHFDEVVIATHADDAYKLLSDPNSRERETLGMWRYTVNDTVLHTEESWMPKEKRAWASWNYKRARGVAGDEPLSITYHMNCLQGLNATNQYFVTLNPNREIPEHAIVRRFSYTHPEYTVERYQTQGTIRSFNGSNHTWYAGSYLGFGFHEDAVRSAVEVAERLSCSL